MLGRGPKGGGAGVEVGPAVKGVPKNGLIILAIKAAGCPDHPASGRLGNTFLTCTQTAHVREGAKTSRVGCFKLSSSVDAYCRVKQLIPIAHYTHDTSAVS